MTRSEPPPNRVPDIRIRKAVPQDAGILADLGARTFTDAYQAETDAQALAAYVAQQFTPARQAAELADPSMTVLIAEVGDTPSAYAVVVDGPPEVPVGGMRAIGLVRLYVDVLAQGMGLGRRLFDACVGEARQRACDTMWLTVWERNTRAIAIYRHWEFREVGEVRFPFGSETHRDLVMARSLAADLAG